MTKQKEYLYSSPLKCIISEEAMMQKGLCAYASGKIDKPVDADHAALLLNNIGEINLMKRSGDTHEGGCQWVTPL